MLAHRKAGLTPLDGPEAAPSVDFAAFPRRREGLTMCRIAGAFSPSGKAAKSISAISYGSSML